MSGEGLTGDYNLSLQQQAIKRARVLAAIAAQGLNGGADTLVTLATGAAGPLDNLSPRDYINSKS